jgi:hypothetical protein
MRLGCAKTILLVDHFTKAEEVKFDQVNVLSIVFVLEVVPL